MTRIRRLVDAAARLDERLLGPDAPDERPLPERLRRPRPAVCSGRGRAAYGVILVGMLAATAWLPEVAGMFVMAGLFAAALIVMATDERRRRRGPHRGH